MRFISPLSAIERLSLLLMMDRNTAPALSDGDSVRLSLGSSRNRV